MKPTYYKMDGTPYEGNDPVLQWAKDMEKGNKIKLTLLPDGIRISTVWLGLDHNLGEGRPLIYESMVFDKDRKELDQVRYATIEKALKDHDRLVKKWKRGRYE